MGFIETFDGMSVEDQQATLNSVADRSGSLIEETEAYQAAVADAGMTTPSIESIQISGILLLDIQLQLDIAFVVSDYGEEPDVESPDGPTDIRGTAVVVVDDNGDARLDDEPSILSLESRGYVDGSDQADWDEEGTEDEDGNWERN